MKTKNKPLEKTRPFPIPSNHGRSWTLDDLILLLQWFREGRSFVDISYELNRSVISSMGKLNELHIVRFNRQLEEYYWNVNGRAHSYRYRQFMLWQNELNKMNQEKVDDNPTN